jgi:hypothetical protein
MKALLFCLSLLAAAAFAQEQSAPRAGQVFQFGTNFPKYVSAHVEFRDAAGARWPSFFYGRPAGAGSLRFDTASPAAAFVLDCNKRPQRNGDQSRRVLGELFPGTNSPGGATLRVSSLQNLAPAPDAKKGGEFSAMFGGQLEMAGRKVPFNAPGNLRYHPGGKGDEKNEALFVSLAFDVKAADLGLKTFAAGDVIQVRAAVTGYDAEAATKPKRK